MVELKAHVHKLGTAINKGEGVDVPKFRRDSSRCLAEMLDIGDRVAKRAKMVESAAIKEGFKKTIKDNS